MTDRVLGQMTWTQIVPDDWRLTIFYGDTFEETFYVEKVKHLYPWCYGRVDSFFHKQVGTKEAAFDDVEDHIKRRVGGVLQSVERQAKLLGIL